MKNTVHVKDLIDAVTNTQMQGYAGIANYAFTGLAKIILSKSMIKQQSQVAAKETAPSLYYVTNPVFDDGVVLDMVTYNAIHYACITTLVDDVTQQGWQIKSVKKNEEDKYTEEIEFLTSFFSKINEEGDDIEDLLKQVALDFYVFGRYAYETPRTFGGRIAELVHTEIMRVKPHKSTFVRNSDFPLFQYSWGIGKHLYLKKFGEKRFYDAYRGVPADENTGIYELATELVYKVNYHPGLYPYYGLTKIVPGWSANQGFNSQRKFNLSYFENLALQTVLKIKGKQTQESIDFVSEFINAEAYGDSLRTLVVQFEGDEGDVEIMPMRQGISEASFTKFNDQCSKEIFMLWGVPPYRAGLAIDMGALGGNYARVSIETYKNKAVTPGQKEMVKTFNRRIIQGDSGFGIKGVELKLNELDITDQELLLEKHKLGRFMAIAKRKEVAEDLGIGHFETGEGEEYIMSKNMQTIERLHEKEDEEKEDHEMKMEFSEKNLENADNSMEGDKGTKQPKNEIKQGKKEEYDAKE